MESVLLDTPPGISARLGWDPKVSVHDRRRILARELVAARLGTEFKDVRVDREAPRHFGYHTRLIATRGGVELDTVIKTASFRGATVVAITDPPITLGLDLRDAHPDDVTVREMQRHSHLPNEENIPALLDHWTRVQAVLEADGRGVRVRPELVRLDPTRSRGWIRDSRAQYRIVDLSRDAWIITLAYRDASAT